MKHTLESLKKCIDTANELGCVMRWIAGFEKELREMLPKNPDSRYRWTDLIKEILGNG